MRGRTNTVVVSLTAAAVVAAMNAAPGLLAAPAQEPADPADPAVAALTEDLDEILADPRLDGGQASVVVRDAATDEVLYSHDGDTRLMPASNEKLFTSTAALDILGTDHTFTTTVATTARRTGRVLVGDLYLRGTGDPTMLAEDFGELADQVAAAGTRVVTGRIVADDTYFDDVRLGNDWAWDDEPYYYAAQVSALTAAPDTDYDAGTVIVQVSPGATAGSPPQVDLVPDNDYVKIVNDASTVAGEGDGISVEREHGSNRIVVSGTIGLDDGVSQDWASVWEPTGYAADIFRNALTERGVRVLGKTAYRATPADARVLAEHQSAPLGEILTPFMKLSNNGHAEILVKTVGREVSDSGSWGAGLEDVRAQLETYGVNIDTMANRDGSGLSRRNLVPAAEVAALLDTVQDKPWFDVWYESLPIAGISERLVGGTLRFRMAGTAAEGNVHAKTGSLTGASALSGYVTDADGDRLIFSVIFNDYLSSKPGDLEDRIAVRLALFSDDVAAAPDAARQLRSVEPPSVPLPDDVECSWIKTC